MSKILAIAITDIRLFLQSRTNLIQVTIIPLAFIVAMGMAFSQGGDEGYTLLLDVVDQDGSAEAAALTAALASANPNVVVCPSEVNEEDPCQLGQEPLTAELALERVTEGITFGSLTVPEGYGAALTSGSGTDLSFTSNADLNAPEVVLRTIERVLTRVGGATVAARLSTEAAEANGLVSEENSTAFYAARYAEAERAWGPPAPIVIAEETTIQEESSGGSSAGFGQSAPGMACMFVMMTVLGMASSLVQERLDGTLPRLIVMPINRMQILGGKMLRAFALGFVQFLLMLVFGSFLGVNFGSNLLAVLIVVVVYVMAVTALGMALATFVKTPEQAGGISLMAAMTLAPLGGAWWPLDVVPQFMRTAGHISPIAWCMDAFNELIFYGGGLPEIVVPVLVLLAFSVVLYGIGIARFRFE